mmetsp:Transcript_11301/g.20332  ORF Transcript_11301/g.20332 Transcript_11301/m.20332 type:complete len:206 (+) Transcript_11301:812-1429(+)
MSITRCSGASSAFDSSNGTAACPIFLSSKLLDTTPSQSASPISSSTASSLKMCSAVSLTRCSRASSALDLSKGAVARPILSSPNGLDATPSKLLWTFMFLDSITPVEGPPLVLSKSHIISIAASMIIATMATLIAMRIICSSALGSSLFSPFSPPETNHLTNFDSLNHFANFDPLCPLPPSVPSLGTFGVGLPPRFCKTTLSFSL